MAATVILAGATLGVVIPGTPAQAAENGVCALNQTPSAQFSRSLPGNALSQWSSPAGQFDGDIFRFTASGSTQIQPIFGAWKPPEGDVNAPAPWSPGNWPRPGVPEYALLVRITAGQAQWVTADNHQRDPDIVAGTNLTPFKWYYIGARSDCVKLFNPPATSFQFIINDTNVGDNSGGPTTAIKQWW